MNVKEYLGDLIGGSLMMAESRTVAVLILEHLTEDEWKQKIVSENMLQKKSGQTAVRYVKTIRSRLEPLGDDFISTLLNADNKTYTQLLMLAFLLHSPVVADFMHHSLQETHRLFKPELATTAWEDFFSDRVRSRPELSQFSESSMKKMGSNAIKAFVDMGYIRSARKRELQAVYLMPETKEWLMKLHKTDLAALMECTL